MRLSNLEKARIAGFIAEEKQGAPEWFLSDAAQNFASPSEIVLYFTAFCGALAQVNTALRQVEAILKRVKTVISAWESVSETLADKEDGAPDFGEGNKLRLKTEEKLIVLIYRSICAGKGGVGSADLAAVLKVPEPKVDEALNTLREKGVLSCGERTKRWALVVS